MRTRFTSVCLLLNLVLLACGDEEPAIAPQSTAGSAGAGAAGAAGVGAGASGAAGQGGQAGSGGSVAGSAGQAGKAGSSGSGPDEYLPPYDPAWALNVKIPEGIGTDPRSAEIVAKLKANISVPSTSKLSVMTRGEVPPIYTVQATDPTYEVELSDSAPIQFRVSVAATSGGGSDNPLLLLDPSHPVFGPYTEYRAWQAEIDHASKTIKASGSGLFHYNNDGSLLNPDQTPSQSIPFAGWGTGSGLSYYAGLVHHREVEQGEIRHALRFAYRNCDSSDKFRPPATKTDQPKGCASPNPGAQSALDMGMRLQLDKSVDCAARTSPVPSGSDGAREIRFVRMICKALQDYGMIMLDGTSGAVAFYLENEITAQWGGVLGMEQWESYSYLLRDQDTPDDGFTRGPLDGIPWEKLRVLEKSVF